MFTSRFFRVRTPRHTAFLLVGVTIGLLTQLQPCFGLSWVGTDNFSSGISSTNWTIRNYAVGQMAVVGANGHASFIVPISTNSEQNAGIAWNGTPAVTNDWTADIVGNNSAGWSAYLSSALKLRVIDTTSLNTTNKQSFALLMTRGDVYQSGQFSTTLSGDNINFRQTVQATNTTFGLRLVHRGGVTGDIEAWYDPTGNGTTWTLLDTISMANFSPSMVSTSTFTIVIVSDCYFGPIVEGNIWVDNFRITNSAIGSIPPQTSLVKAVVPTFSNLMTGTNYQLQVSTSANGTFTNYGSVFTATNFNMTYPQYWNVVSWNQLYFRLQVSP